MNAGSLKHRITFQKYSTITNENGFDEEKWVDFKTVWAAMNNLFGKEYYAAMAVQAENDVVFTIRFFKELNTMDTKTYRIKVLKDSTANTDYDKYRFFNITFIDNVLYENRWVKVKGVEGRFNGSN